MSVYVTKDEGKFDLSPALKFGEIEVIATREFPIFSEGGEETRRIREKLKHFSDNDYLLLVGDPIIIGIATHYASFYNRGKVKFLKWSPRSKDYQVVDSQL